MTEPGKCRFCSDSLRHTFVDLGLSPLSNAFVEPERVGGMHAFFPLHAYVCGRCYLVQLEEFESPEGIFTEYAYFSSYSTSWLKHCEAFASTARARFGLNEKSLVVEIASNDGYLLRYFKDAGVPVLGVEPALNVARVAREKFGIESVGKFFGVSTAKELAESGRMSDLLIGNNVLAHVPDINDFVGGMKIALKPGGQISVEFPHLLRLIEENQFDTIYHEHFSYLSLLTTSMIFEKHDLRVFDVDALPTHGGSLRVYGCHREDPRETVPAVAATIDSERNAGLDKLETYARFPEKARRVKNDLLRFLFEQKAAGKSVVGYGAPAKGNTLLNFAGIRTDLIDYTVDRNPYKQGRLTPGTLIPVKAPEAIEQTKPDFVLILPWNLKDEIIEQLSAIRDWGGKFVIAIPELQIL